MGQMKLCHPIVDIFVLKKSQQSSAEKLEQFNEFLAYRSQTTQKDDFPK